MHETVIPMTWDDVVADATLQDLPYKIELNDDGKIVMSPAKVRHSIMAARIQKELRALHPVDGEVLAAVAVQCRNSLRVIETDAAWVSDDWLARNADSAAAVTAPEICAEAMSPSNSRAEMLDKVARYLEAGAREVWIYDMNGNKTVHTRAA